MDSGLLQRGSRLSTAERSGAPRIEEDGHSGLGRAVDVGAWLGVRPTGIILGLIKRPNDGGRLSPLWSLMRLVAGPSIG